MEFDEILSRIKSFGRYQQLIYIPMSIGSGMTGLMVVASIFIQATPLYRCASPWYPNDTYLIQDAYHEFIVNMSMPWEEEDNGVWSLSMTKIFSAKQNTSSQLANATTKLCEKWVYDRSVFTETAITEFNLVDTNGIFIQTLMGFSVMAGMLIGSTICGIVSDRFGRKKSFFIGVTFTSIFGLVVAWSPNVYVYIIFRFLIGASGVFMFLSNFVYGVELVGLDKRVLVEMIPMYTWPLSLMLLVFNGYFIRNWRILQTVNSVTVILFVVLYPIVPESPRWLLTKGRTKEAEEILRNAAKWNGRTLPDKLFNDRTLEKVEEIKIKEFFKSKRLLLRTLNIYFSWLVVSMTYYGLTLNTGSLSGDIFINNLISASVEFPATLFCQVALNPIGRRKLHAFLLLASGVSLIAAIFIVVYAPHINWLLVFWTMLGKAFITAAFVTVYVFTGELFPTIFRNTGMGTSSTCARVGSMTAPVLVTLGKLIPGVFSKAFPLIIFGVFALTSGGLTFLLPETRGLPLPETLNDAKMLGKSTSKAYLDTGEELPESNSGIDNSAVKNEADEITF